MKLGKTANELENIAAELNALNQTTIVGWVYMSDVGKYRCIVESENTRIVLGAGPNATRVTWLVYLIVDGDEALVSRGFTSEPSQTMSARAAMNEACDLCSEIAASFSTMANRNVYGCGRKEGDG